MPRRDVAQPLLRQVDLPLARGDARLFVRVRVAEHHLLDITAQRDEQPVARLAEKVVEKLARPAQLVDRLEQRDEAQPRDPGVEINEASLSRQHHGCQQVVRATAHRDDVRLDHVVAEAFLCRAHGLERRVGPRAWVVQRRRRRCERAT